MNQQNIFYSLLSPNNEERKKAEEVFNNIKDFPFNESIKVFVEGIEHSVLNIRNLALVLLKKTYIDNIEYYKILDNNSRNELKKYLYSVISFDKELKFLNRIADVFAKMYTNSVDELPELLAYVVKTFDSENYIARQFSIYIIEALCDLGTLKDEIVSGAVENFNTIFKKGLRDSVVKVRISTLKATTQFLANLSDLSLVHKFDSLFEFILDSVIYALKNEVDDGLLALNTLNNLADNHPKYFKQNLETLINIVCQIVNEGSFSEKIKTSAVELISSLSANIPVCLRNSENFNKMYLPMIFNMLLQIDNQDDKDLDKWRKSTDEKDVDLPNLYYTARTALESLSINLGGDHMLKYSFVIIEKLVDSKNWIECHAGYTAIAWMTEGCKDVFKKNYESLLRKVCLGIENPHPRVRWSALTSLAILLTFLAPTLQKKFHSELVPALIKLMTINENDKEKELRVKTQATSTMVNFLKGLTEMLGEEEKKRKTPNVNKLLKPYVNGILEALSRLFEFSLTTNYYPLQEETLTGISLLATVLDKEFAQYYPLIMPGLKKVLYSLDSNKSKEFGELKANAIQTIAYLVSSVGECSENFVDDFKEICTYFIRTLAELKDDDTLVPAILSSFSHLAEGLKENFVPFYESLFPKLESYLKADIDFKFEDAELSDIYKEQSGETGQKNSGLDGTLLRLKGVGDKKISVKTFALQNKILAVEVLSNICASMEKSFLPYLSEYLECSKTLMKFPYSRKIRKISIKALSECLKCCSSEDEMKEVIDFGLEEILNILSFHTGCFFLRDIKSSLKTLINAFEQIDSPNVIDLKLVSKVYENLKSIISTVEDKKEKYKKMIKEKNDTDENDLQHIDQDMNIFNEVNRRIMEINGILLSIYKEDIIELVVNSLYDSFYNIWMKMVNETKDVQEAMYCVCFFNDLLEFSKYEDFLKLYPEYMKLCNVMNATDYNLIELIINGFGFICQRLDKQTFSVINETVFKSIYSIINSEDAFDDCKCMCTDNAISSLGKYCLFQCLPNENGFKLMGEFLEHLPLNNDLEEGCEIVKLLLRELYKENIMVTHEHIKQSVNNAFARIQKMRLEDEEFLDTEGLGLLILALPKLNINISC